MNHTGMTIWRGSRALVASLLACAALPSEAFANGCLLFTSPSCFGLTIMGAMAIALPVGFIGAGALLTMVMQGFVRRRTPWMAAVCLSFPVALIGAVLVGEGLDGTALFENHHRVWALLAWVGLSSLLQLGYVVLCGWLLDAHPLKLGE